MLPKRRCCVCLLEREDKDFLIFCANVVCKGCVKAIATWVMSQGAQIMEQNDKEKEVKDDATKSGDGV